MVGVLFWLAAAVLMSNPTEPQGLAAARSTAASKTDPETLDAPGFAGQLLRGLDGQLYRPYLPATIKQVQLSLKERGLYDGPVNGILDAPTMRSVLAFQQANPLLQRCGIPTPLTRKLLEQGSHTDAATLRQAPVNGRIRQ